MDNKTPVIIDKTALDAAVELGKQLSFMPGIDERVHYAVLPQGLQIVSLLSYQYPHGLPPERIAAKPSFQDAASFCRYCLDFKDERLRVFADASSVRFHAILDYHLTDDRETKAEFCSHQAYYQMALSTQWSTWFNNHDKLIPQDAFAEFLEDNYRDIQNPSHADMLQVARELKATSEMNFESKIVPKSGAVQLKWQEDMKTTGVMEVPDVFQIAIPVFFGQAPVTIDCRLRFRIVSGKLSFLYKMYRPAETKLEAFRTEAAAVSESLGVEVHLGTAG